MIGGIPNFARTLRGRPRSSLAPATDREFRRCGVYSDYASGAPCHPNCKSEIPRGMRASPRESRPRSLYPPLAKLGGSQNMPIADSNGSGRGLVNWIRTQIAWIGRISQSEKVRTSASGGQIGITHAVDNVGRIDKRTQHVGCR